MKTVSLLLATCLASLGLAPPRPAHVVPATAQECGGFWCFLQNSSNPPAPPGWTVTWGTPENGRGTGNEDPDGCGIGCADCKRCEQDITAVFYYPDHEGGAFICMAGTTHPGPGTTHKTLKEHCCDDTCAAKLQLSTDQSYFATYAITCPCVP